MTTEQQNAWCDGDWQEDVYAGAQCDELVEPADGNWIGNGADELALWLAEWADWLADSYVRLVGQFIGGDWNNVGALYPNSAPPEWGTPDCEWTQEFDFLLGDQLGWYTEANLTSSAGVWSPVSGFRASVGLETDDDTSKSVRIVRDFDTRTITYFQITGKFEKVSTGSPLARFIFYNAVDPYDQQWLVAEEIDPYVFTDFGSRALSQVHAQFRVALGVGYPHGYANIEKIIIKGLGSNPFT